MLRFIIIEVMVKFEIGIALHKLGRKEDAIIDYSNAIELNPQFANAYVNRGNFLEIYVRKCIERSSKKRGIYS